MNVSRAVSFRQFCTKKPSGKTEEMSNRHRGLFESLPTTDPGPHKKNRVNRLCGLSKFFSAGQLDEPGPLDLLLPDQRLLPPPSRCHRWRLPWDSHGNVHTVKTKTLFTTNLEAFVTMSFSRLRKEDLAFGRFYPEEIRLFYDLFALSVIP